MDNSATPEPQPAASLSQRPRFQFGLRTLLLLFVVLGSSLGVFGAWGIIVFGLEVGLAVYMHGAQVLRAAQELRSRDADPLGASLALVDLA